jgi:hypothetical protein
MRDAVALTALVALGSLCACSSSSSPSDAGGGDAIADHTSRDAGRESGLGDLDATADVPPMPYEAPPPPSLGGIRVANWSASAPPVDFCFAPHGTAKWQGPMLASAGPQDPTEYPDGSAPGFTFSDGGTAGLGYPGVTTFFYLPPGQYDLRFVAAGSPHCEVPIVAPDSTALPALSKDGLVTVALLVDIAGDASAGMQMVAGFVDDLSVPTALGTGRIGVRFINAAPTALVAGLGYAPPAYSSSGSQVGSLDSPTYVSLFTDVPYGHASSPSETTVLSPFVDDAGYVFEQASSFPVGLTGAGGVAAYGGAPAETTFNATATQGPSQITLAVGPSSVVAGLMFTEVLLVGGASSGPSDGGDAGTEGGAFQLMQCIQTAGVLALAGACSVISN